ncbi:YtfJ family protein [Serratia sp. AKBS12]|uniref:YtfJ family protein n=1 Tax=Serratia sp. AKBS12 TaxID=2974597 RepID=UPI00216581DE|nr:YtfJ family protein [Serratia sp. AKBS12]MCS3406045.1 YtfJ family protein [Serratia sp. AKBS12]HEI8867863.1 YtfJ family protein [Serratia odorifera]
MKKSNMLIVSLLFAPLLACAHNFQIQQRVAPVGVSDRGELNYANDDFSYKNWNSGQLSGKVRVIQHIAGRSSAKEMNDPLIEAIKQAKLPRDRYQTTTIVNTDDALVGTAMFVRSSIEDSKQEFPWSQFIVDSNGNVRKAWDLQPGGSAIIVLDKQGKIQFAKDGKLTAEEVQQVMNKLHQLLAD